MAAPITHAVLSDKVFDTFFSDKDKKKFFIGTLFPDIRYLGDIDRKKTHMKGLTLKDVQNEQDSFMCGLKFHSLVDELREDFVVSKDVYSHVPDFKYTTQSLKFFEDMFLYNKVDTWSEYSGYFNEVLAAETDMGVPEHSVRKWHTMIQEYFSNQPTAEDLKNFISQIPFPDPKEVGIQISKASEILKQSSELEIITEAMYSTFNEQCETYGI